MDEEGPSPKKIRRSQQSEVSGLDDPSEVIEQQKQVNQHEPIVLNVGGTRYETSLSTLLSHDTSFFNKMFNGTYSTQPSLDGSYFIDRDGRHFHFILSYLRRGKVHIPSQNKLCVLDNLLEEAAYYQLTTLVRLIKTERVRTSSTLKFDQTAFGGNLRFIGDMKVTYDILDDLEKEDAPICLLHDAVSAEMCDEYILYLKLEGLSKEDSFFMYDLGYVQSRHIEFRGGLINMLDGICIDGQGPGGEQSYDKSDNVLDDERGMTRASSQGIALSFNFVTDKFKFFQNNKLIHTMSLHGLKFLIPAISMTYDNNTVTLIKHEFK